MILKNRHMEERYFPLEKEKTFDFFSGV